MNTISFTDLEKRNYNPKNISNFKLINGICIRCNNSFEYSKVKKFLRSRKKSGVDIKLWNTCSSCWHKIQTSENPIWITNNIANQFIAQNKPEQKLKNAIGVAKSWTKERRIKNSQYLKDRWKNDESFAKHALENISWTQQNDGRYDRIIKLSLGSGGLKGIYNNIRYESALELSYILYCIDNNILIKRYDLSPIPYIDENNKQRLYIPDFIIDNNTIVEIKGYGLYYTKNFERNNIKFDTLKKWGIQNNFNIRLLLSTDKILKQNYNKARKLHHENKKKNINTV